ncbi:MAG: ComEC family competence protein [Paludibacteraceae bacterium]|nr:ComEC family competence protein [Paludibacteraceae bacterium]
MRKIPFLGPCVALIIGILAAECCVGYAASAWVGTAAVAAILLSLALPKDYYKIKRTVTSVAVLFFFVAIGIIAKTARQERTVLSDEGQRGVYELVVTSMPSEKERSFGVETKIVAFSSDSQSVRPSDGRVIVYLQKNETAKSLRIGDTIVASCAFTKPTAQFPSEPDYGEYLRHKGISGTGYCDTLHFALVGRNTAFSVRQLAWDCRVRLIGIYERFGLTGDELAIASALTLGFKEDLSDDIRQTYSDAGVMHILAVSGLHVGIVFAIIAFMLGFFSNSGAQRRLKSVVIILAIWVYAFVTGLSPSVTRASFMLSVILFGYVIGRRPVMLNTLFLSAFVLLLFNPDNIYDIGFQLSYSAVLGIFMFFKPISDVLSDRDGWHRVSWRHTPLKMVALWAWDLAAMSVAAQVGTLPLSLYYFHKFSVYFLLANYAAIPLATVIIWTAAMLLILNWVPLVSSFFAGALSWLIGLQNSFITTIGNLPHSVVRTWVTELDAVLLVVVVVLLWLSLEKKRLSFVTAAVAVLLLFLSVRAVRHYEMSRQNFFVVYDQKGRKNLSVEHVSGFSHTLFTTDPTVENHLAYWWLRRSLDEPQVEELCGEMRIVMCGGLRVVLLPPGVNLRGATAEPMEVDVIVVGGGVKAYYEDLRRLFRFDEVVLAPSVSRKTVAKFTELGEKDGKKIWSMYQKGMYLCE